MRMRWLVVLLLFVLLCGCLSEQPKVSACESKGDDFLRDACYMEYAVLGNNSILCSNIKGGNTRIFCESIMSRDVSGCDKVNATDDSRFACYAYAGRDPSQCDSISSNETKTSCYKTFILLNTEPDKCEKFTDAEYKKSCLKKFN